MFATVLVEGLRHATLGPSFLDSAPEPTMASVEARLADSIANGEMQDIDPRGPAIALIAPVPLAFLHRGELGGDTRRPMQTGEFLAEHAAAFVRAWRALGNEKAIARRRVIGTP